MVTKEDFDFIQEVEFVKKELNQKLEDNSRTIEMREEVDKLIVEISNTIQNFVIKSDLLRSNGILASMASHRALFFMAMNVSYNWALSATAAAYVRKNLKVIKGDKR